jgi:L-rhamnose isomerase
VRGEYLDRTHIGLDFFDASINRVAAWVIGTHNALRAMLMALLEPTTHLRELELSGDFTARLALFEEMKCMPFGSIWDYHCLRQGVPVGISYLDSIRKYEKQVLAQRG